jgi:hypothetical protein
VIATLAESDPDNKVRAAAMTALADTKSATYATIAQKTLANPTASYGCVGAALQLLQAGDSKAALAAAKNLENEKSGAISEGIAKIYAMTGDAAYLPFFENRLTKIGGQSAIGFLANYGDLLKALPEATQTASAEKLVAFATNMDSNMYARFAATKTISDLKKAATDGKKENLVTTLQAMIENVKAKETNKMLKQYYSAF